MMDGEHSAAGAARPAPGQDDGQASRERLADQREALADEREQRADQREALADERQRQADERERAADERERAVDERERAVDEHMRKLDELAKHAGSDLGSLDQRTMDAIGRARVLLALSAERLNRQEARVGRRQADRTREQAAVDRASAEGERGIKAMQRDPGQAVDRNEALRKRAREVIEDLARSADEVALSYEERAASDPGRREEYQRMAGQAREAAGKACEFLRGFGD